MLALETNTWVWRILSVEGESRVCSHAASGLIVLFLLHLQRSILPTLAFISSFSSPFGEMSTSVHGGGVHPVLTLINRCDELARTFDSTFESSCTLLTNLANGTPAPGSPTTMDDTLMALRETLEKCEGIVGSMLNCIYADIPHLLDQIDSGSEGTVGNFNPKQALDSISQLFYVSHHNTNYHTVQRKLTFSKPHSQSYQELLLEKRELLADFTCEEISPSEFVNGWTQIDNNLTTQRKQQVDDLADLLAAF